MRLGVYLRQVLVADPDVAALVADRVFSEVLPQLPTVPAVVFNVVAGGDDYALEGPTGARVRRVQVDSWGATRAAATSLGRAVSALLSGHAGAAGGLEVQGCFLLSELWDFESETKLWRTIHDFEVHLLGAES